MLKTRTSSRVGSCLTKETFFFCSRRRQSTYFAKCFFMNGLKLVCPISSGKILFLFLINNFLVHIYILKTLFVNFPWTPPPPPPPTPRQETANMNGTDMLVVSFRGLNYGFRFSNRHVLLVLRTDCQCFYSFKVTVLLNVCVVCVFKWWGSKKS